MTFGLIISFLVLSNIIMQTLCNLLIYSVLNNKNIMNLKWSQNCEFYVFLCQKIFLDLPFFEHQMTRSGIIFFVPFPFWSPLGSNSDRKKSPWKQKKKCQACYAKQIKHVDRFCSCPKCCRIYFRVCFVLLPAKIIS